MIKQDISEKVLTIGCKFHPPYGGVPYVLYNYEQYVFPQFKHITNSGKGNIIYKLAKAVSALLIMVIKLIIDRKIKIIHIHTASYNSFKRSASFVKLSKIFHKKVILHIHGGGFKEYYVTNPRFITSILNTCDVIITLSESWKKLFSEITTCNNIYILENIVPKPLFKRENKSIDCLHLLFLGLITESKGIFDLLDVIHDNMNELKGKIMLHVGGNGKTEEFKKAIKDYGLDDYVTFEGWVSGKKKESILQQANVFILPSYTEGLPISILEAMSYKLPILSTPIGGIPEVVKDGVNGYLFSPGDKKSMYLCIKKIIDNKKQRLIMGEESFKIIKPYFPLNIENKLQSIYEKIL